MRTVTLYLVGDFETLSVASFFRQFNAIGPLFCSFVFFLKLFSPKGPSFLQQNEFLKKSEKVSFQRASSVQLSGFSGTASENT